MHTLRGTGKPELLANEMKRYKLSIVALTETHLDVGGEMPLDEEGKYIILFCGRQDGQNVEGVGLALSSQAWAAMRHHLSVAIIQNHDSRILHPVGHCYSICHN